MNNEVTKWKNEDSIEFEYVPASKSELGIDCLYIRGNEDLIKTVPPSKYYIKKNYKVKPDTRVP